MLELTQDAGRCRLWVIDAGVNVWCAERRENVCFCWEGLTKASPCGLSLLEIQVGVEGEACLVKGLAILEDYALEVGLL